jgi:hypothetical protein
VHVDARSDEPQREEGERGRRGSWGAPENVTNQGAEGEQPEAHGKDDDGVHLALLRLPDVEPHYFARGRELKVEVRSEIPPFIRVKCTDQVQPVVVDAFNRSEPLMTERVPGELVETAGAAVVVEFGIGLEER